jgi:outer membrane protein
MPALAQGAKTKPAAPSNPPKANAPGTSSASPAETAPPAVDAAVPAAVPAAAGQYRIGVVSRQQVLKKYNKVKAEYEKLQGKVKTEQTDIDKLSDKIEGMKKDYEAQKETMTPEDRATKEAAVQKEYSQYRNMLATKQQEIDTEEQLLVRTVMAEVDQVVSKIATEQGFHLVLEGSSRSGVLYYSPTIDITQRVVDALNSKQ